MSIKIFFPFPFSLHYHTNHQFLNIRTGVVLAFFSPVSGSCPISSRHRLCVVVLNRAVVSPTGGQAMTCNQYTLQA